MTILTGVAGRLVGLPPRTTGDVRVDRELRIPLADGVVLLADRWYPSNPEGCPVILSRTPYGRGVDGFMGRLFAERGFQFVVVSCRGTFGSGGEWRPFFNEAADGLEVLGWLDAQPWCGGDIGLFGASYGGLTQWSVAAEAPVSVKAWAPSVTGANFAELIYPGGVFALESMLVWIDGLVRQEQPWRRKLLAMLTQRRRLRPALDAVPVGEADVVGAGARVPYFQEWLEHDLPDDPWWAPIDYRRDLGRMAPATLVAGWWDLFAPSQMRDFEAMTAAGCDVRLRVGPWTHAKPGAAAAFLRDSFEWMDIHLRGAHRGAGDKVRLWVVGANRWESFEAWPPASTPASYQLHPAGRLSQEEAVASEPDRYRYDPADPTPVIGGMSLSGRTSGPKDNRRVEARPDVLTYTTDVLTDDLTVIGKPSVRLFARSSLDDTDFFARLCDVAPNGRSTNVCDGIVRYRAGERVGAAFDLELSPTAMTFRAGHRIRLQVSSGAHPIYARNLGSGEPLGKATTFVPADQEVFHDPERPSAIVLPVAPTVRRGRTRRSRRPRGFWFASSTRAG